MDVHVADDATTVVLVRGDLDDASSDDFVGEVVDAIATPVARVLVYTGLDRLLPAR